MKILQIGMGNVAGGLEAFVMNYYRVLVHMDIQFDFVCMYDKIAYEEEIRKLGGRIYYIPNVKKNYQGYIKELKKILKETKYDAVHVNMLSAANIVPLRVAHTMKVPKIIAHSHSSSCPGLIRKIMDNWNRPKIAKYATDRIACGEMAGRWLFGDKAFQSGQVTLINNAIQAEKFSFSEKDRDSLRKELGWENKTVIGHVGRFDIPKNHDRMLDIFQQIVSEKKDVMLCLVGPKEGLYKEIKEKTVQKGLEDKVYFAGKQENIRRYLSAMDVFLFPSVFEGVPFALIEAQANGLACVMSEAVSEEAVVFPERVRRLSLDRNNIQWAAAVMAMSSMNREAADLIKMRPPYAQLGDDLFDELEIYIIIRGKLQMDKIDFVLPWVDGSDSAWIKQRNEYLGIKNDQTQDSRFRDWENLQYWFRGVEKFAPWVNHIYFVTWGHIPSWLNTDHPKLTVVKHEDYIPKQYLPTFSSHPIELNMHRIRGLSEQFVYFNDDTFIINKMEPEDFFRNGLPRDYCIETALVQDDINNPFACILMNNAALVNMHYSKREVIGRNWKKWFHPAYGKMVFRNMLMLPYREFSSFKYSHISSSFLKSTFEEVWREEGEVLDRVCRTRFRSRGDVNQYVMKYWQYMEGKYEPQSPKIEKFFTIGLHDRQIHDVLRNQKCKILCINDTENIGDFRQQKRNIKDSFESILPEKSAFELSYKDSGGMYDKKCD